MGRRWGRSDPQSRSPKDAPLVASLAHDAVENDVISVDVVDVSGCVSMDSHAMLADAAPVLKAPDTQAKHSRFCPVASSVAVKGSEPQLKTAPRGQGAGPFMVWWVGKVAERVFERREAALRLDDPVPSREKSEAAAEYRLRIIATYLRDQGWTKERVAEKLERALGWVTLWWDKSPDDVARPNVVPKYVADYNLRMLKCGIEPFRPAVLRRRYVTDTEGLYSECAQQMPWRQAVFRRRNYETGGVTVTGIPSSRQDSSYPGLTTGITRLDAALERIRVDFDIRDPRCYLLNNFYPDGNTSIAPHTHDFWSAILSFGASRVFTVDGHPLLLGDGDLLVIGTQRHAVPKMPDVKEGRVSVAIFWYPENRRDFWPALDGSGCAQCGKPRYADDGAEQLQESGDGNLYCQECWLEWRADSGHAGLGDVDPHREVEDASDAADDDILAAALQMSLVDY